MRTSIAVPKLRTGDWADSGSTFNNDFDVFGGSNTFGATNSFGAVCSNKKRNSTGPGVKRNSMGAKLSLSAKLSGNAKRSGDGDDGVKVANPPPPPQAGIGIFKAVDDDDVPEAGAAGHLEVLPVQSMQSKLSNLEVVPVQSTQSKLSSTSSVYRSKSNSSRPGADQFGAKSTRSVAAASYADHAKKAIETELIQVQAKENKQKSKFEFLENFVGKMTSNDIKKDAWILSDRANVLFGSVILLNAVYVGVEVDRRKQDVGIHEEPWWFTIESLFLLVFVVELALRIRAFKWRTFSDPWNFFDFVLVLMGVMDTWVMSLMALNSGEKQGGMDAVLVLRIVRILRLLRVLRILRLFRFFRELLLLAQGIMGAMRALVWAVSLIMLVLYICAIIINRLLGQPDASHEKSEEVVVWFGTVGRSLFTLFQLMSLENWPQVVRTCMMYQPLIWLFFVPFLVVTHYTLLNLVTAVVVENVLVISQKEHMAEVKREEQARFDNMRLLKQLFEDMDDDENGELSVDEFRNALTDDSVIAQFHQLEIAHYEALDLFELLDIDHDGAISVSEFVEGCLRVRGLAKAKHLLAVQYDLQKFWNDIRSQLDVLVTGLDELQQIEDAAAEKQEQAASQTLSENAVPTQPSISVLSLDAPAAPGPLTVISAPQSPQLSASSGQASADAAAGGPRPADAAAGEPVQTATPSSAHLSSAQTTPTPSPSQLSGTANTESPSQGPSPVSQPLTPLISSLMTPIQSDDMEDTQSNVSSRSNKSRDREPRQHPRTRSSQHNTTAHHRTTVAGSSADGMATSSGMATSHKSHRSTIGGGDVDSMAQSIEGVSNKSSNGGVFSRFRGNRASQSRLSASKESPEDDFTQAKSDKATRSSTSSRSSLKGGATQEGSQRRSLISQRIADLRERERGSHESRPSVGQRLSKQQKQAPDLNAMNEAQAAELRETVAAGMEKIQGSLQSLVGGQQQVQDSLSKGMETLTKQLGELTEAVKQVRRREQEQSEHNQVAV